jgi:molybdenum cofactor biosynthesis enzyme MoaA
MRIRTFSIVAGSLACQARCPFCIAGMTPENGLTTKEPEVNWRNFGKACELAKQSGCITAMITGKGEPTLFPEQITKFLRAMEPHKFPIIEMQTNGIAIAEGKHVTDQHLKDWYDAGLTTIALSVVHYDAEKNRKIYVPKREKYIDLPALIQKLHDKGFSVRLTTIMAKGLIDSVEEVKAMIEFARTNKVEQLTLTPVTKPDESENQSIYTWTAQNHLDPQMFQVIKSYIEGEHSLLLNLAHGAKVFDVNGQNVCLSNCITVDPNSEEMRSIIFFPDGHVRYAWQYSGAVLF